MKKSLLKVSFWSLGILILTSCRKNYVCQCGDGTGHNYVTVGQTRASNQKNAVKKCNGPHVTGCPDMRAR